MLIKKYFLLSAVLSFLFLGQMLMAQGSVFISELCDPNKAYYTDRFIEIYNAGDSQVDLAGWSLVAMGNGAEVYTWDLSGTILPGEALVAGNPNTVSNFNVDFGDDGWNASSSSGGAYTWNGKAGDGAKLIDSDDNTIDYIVIPDNPSKTFENQDFVRNSSILVPNTSYDESEWTATAVDSASLASPGTHTVMKPVNNPNIKTVILNPENPIDGESVLVSAIVKDASASISSVTLFWGLSSDDLTNEILLSSSNDSTYTAVSSIPAQAGGTSVYYLIRAINSVSDTASTYVMEYYVARMLSISQIQGSGTDSPYAGEEAATSGIVTGVYDGYATIQDGSDERHGLWVKIDDGLEVGYSVKLYGSILEDDNTGFEGTTLLSDVIILDTIGTSETIYDPVQLTAAQAATEDYEGMLVAVSNAVCVDDSEEWKIEDESGTILVDNLGYSYEPVLGSTYNVIGTIVNLDGEYFIEPRDYQDASWIADTNAPQLERITVISSTIIEAYFTENISWSGAANNSYFAVDGISADSSIGMSGDSSAVIIWVSELTSGEHEFVVSGLEDRYGNAIISDTVDFYYLVSDAPAGYYDPVANLKGQELRQALHDIIDDHTSISYSAIWNAFYSTDAKSNGKVWDIYSDTPGEEPPYEYEFGTDQAGSGGGGVEGDSYNREHTWPKSWFGGEVPPMYTDLFIVYPTDSRVNSLRNNNPYGEVDSPTWTSLNGSKMGPCSYPGYVGTVFEPIDEYKGDLARTYFYITTRYYGEDDDWPGSDMVDGADLKEWALNMMLEWSEEDPVSQKEVARNNAIYEIQGNRNPFIDHPQFVEDIFDTTTTDVNDETPVSYKWQLSQNYPNPFNPTTRIEYSIVNSSNVTLKVYDILGREVMTLVNKMQSPGSYEVVMDASKLSSGIYVYRLSAGDFNAVRKMVLLK